MTDGIIWNIRHRFLSINCLELKANTSSAPSHMQGETLRNLLAKIVFISKNSIYVYKLFFKDYVTRDYD